MSTLAMLFVIQLLEGLCDSSNTTFLVAVDQVQNNSVIAAVMRAIESINFVFPELLDLLEVKYLINQQVCTVQLILNMIVYVVA